VAWTDPVGHVWITGEVVTAGSLNTYVRLNLQELGNAPFCRAYSTVNRLADNAVSTPLVLDAERQDNTAIHNTGSPTRLTAPTAGAYALAGSLVFAGAAGGTQRSAILRVNGGATVAQQDTNPNGANNTSVATATIYRLAAGDYVELLAYQNSGAAINVNAVGSFSPELSIARLNIG